MQPLEGKMAIPEAYIESFDNFLSNKLGESYMGDYYNYEDMYPDFTNFLTAKNKADTENMESRFISSINVASSNLSPEANKKFEVGDAYNTKFNSNAQPETIANLLNLQEGNNMRDLFEMINNQGENKSPLGNRANGILGNLLGVDSSRLSKIAQAANTMRYRPDQQLQASLQEEIEQAEVSKRANATAQYLEAVSPEIAGMVREGLLKPSDALTYLSNINKPSSWQLMSYQQWKKENPTGSMQDFLKLKTPSTNINMGAKDQFKRLDDFSTILVQGASNLEKYDAMRDLILNSDLQTGPIKGRITQLAPFLNALGIKIEGANEGEVFKSLVAQLELRMIPKGQGTITENERKTIKEQIGGLATTKEGLLAILDYLTEFQTIDMQVAKLGLEAGTDVEAYSQSLKDAYLSGNKIPTWNPETQQFE